MLMGEFHHNLDAKGRIIVPAKLREDLGTNIIITRGIEDCLFIYSESEWNKVVSKLKTLPITKKDARSFTRMFLSGATNAEFDKQGNCLSIEEKPKEPKSNYAVVGLYFYPNKVVDVAKHINPSARGELEITTVNQEFLKDGELKVQVFGRGFACLDTGTHDSLAEASTFVEVIEKRQGLKVACLEGIAYRNGWISEERMREIAKPMLKNQYGQYLLKVINEMKEDINSGTLEHV